MSELFSQSRSAPPNRQSIKKGVDVSACRSKREELTVQIRKNKREEGLAKRRNLSSFDSSSDDPTSSYAEGDAIASSSSATAFPPPSSSEDVSSKALDLIPTPESLLSHKNVLLNLSSPLPSLHRSLKTLRKMLSHEETPPTEQCISMGLLPIFVAYLSHSDDKLRFEAAWALTNIAATDRTRDVAMEPNCLDYLVRGLDDEHQEVREQAGWCLGNIAGDCVELR